MRLKLGVDVTVLEIHSNGLELASRHRLQPGRVVTLERRTAASGGEPRHAIVWTWWLVRMGTEGVEYRGICRWV
jgi:hypothetical protein